MGLRPIDSTVSVIFVMPSRARTPRFMLRKAAGLRGAVALVGLVVVFASEGVAVPVLEVFTLQWPRACRWNSPASSGRDVDVIMMEMSLLIGCPSRAVTSRRMTARRAAEGGPIASSVSQVQVLQVVRRPWSSVAGRPSPRRRAGPCRPAGRALAV